MMMDEEKRDASPDDVPEAEERPTDAEDAQAEAPEAAAAEQAPPDPAAEIAALNDKLLRSLAEMENLRRRAQREKEDASKYAIAKFAGDMVSVADNLHRALEAAPENPGEADDGIAALVEGVSLTERELQAAFERHGIVPIDPAGEKFDHDRHEAMFEVPTADAAPGTIVQVMQIGYMIGDRLLRPARVGVARRPPDEAAESHVDTKI